MHIRVAWWHIFRPKIQICENFGVSWSVIFWWHLEYFTALWYILCQFGKFCGHLVHYYPFLVCFTEKNLATLVYIRTQRPFRKCLCTTWTGEKVGCKKYMRKLAKLDMFWTLWPSKRQDKESLPKLWVVSIKRRRFSRFLSARL
jgi:hypothetical protein